MYRKMLFVLLVVLLAITMTGCKRESGLANPASVYCEEQGGTLDIRDEDGGQVGYCIFADGSECEEWAFYRGECGPESD
ncbi:MAG: DUF333 domain-containing protein [Anaerolineaceae bacterium]|nr:DUF333 domain-containing protein [Anaerolineaceae bacterium]